MLIGIKANSITIQCIVKLINKIVGGVFVIMSFLSFAFKNPFRSKLRVLFTVLLLMLGILAVMGSIGFAEVMGKFFQDSVYKGGSDLNIGNEYYVNLTDLNVIKSIDSVQNAVAVSYYGMFFNGDSLSSMVGFMGKSLENNVDIEGIGKISVIDGTLFGDNSNEIVITEKMANSTNKKVGDTLLLTKIYPNVLNTDNTPSSTDDSSNSVSNFVISSDSNTSVDDSNNLKAVKKEFKVVGIINNLPELDGIVPVQTVNNILYNSSELKFNTIATKAKDGQLEKLKTTLNQTYPEYTVTSGDTLANTIKEMLLYVTFFFVGIGALIMMLVTSKSISERTKEIGMLKAIGWSNKRVTGLILTESLTQLILAWILVFIILAIILVYYSSMPQETEVLSFLKENTSTILYTLGISFAFSSLMPLLGCILPLLRVVRLKHTEALKYE